MGGKHCGKRRNCLSRAISPFPTVFSKGLFPRGVKRRLWSLCGNGLIPVSLALFSVPLAGNASCNLYCCSLSYTCIVSFECVFPIRDIFLYHVKNVLECIHLCLFCKWSKAKCFANYQLNRYKMTNFRLFQIERLCSLFFSHNVFFIFQILQHSGIQDHWNEKKAELNLC